jgi:hypothetical protein
MMRSGSLGGAGNPGASDRRGPKRGFCLAKPIFLPLGSIAIQPRTVSGQNILIKYKDVNSTEVGPYRISSGSFCFQLTWSKGGVPLRC